MKRGLLLIFFSWARIELHERDWVCSEAVCKEWDEGVSCSWSGPCRRHVKRIGTKDKESEEHKESEEQTRYQSPLPKDHRGVVRTDTRSGLSFGRESGMH